MDSLKDYINDIRIFLYGGMRSLPLTIAGTLLVLGLFTANYAMLFFLVGYLLLVPLLSGFLGWLLKFVFDGTDYFQGISSDVCGVTIPYSTLNSIKPTTKETTVLSPWLAMVSFFFGYIGYNAKELYTYETTSSDFMVTTDNSPDIENKTTTRRTQAIIGLCMLVIVVIATLYYRNKTGCESLGSFILTIGMFGSLGWTWYGFLSKVGQNRLSDMFGIANRLISPSAMKNGPIACIPQP